MQKIDKKLEKIFKQAVSCFENKEYFRALKLYKNIILKYPNFLPAINNFALTCEFLDKLNEAEHYYNLCFLKEPHEIIYINNLANIYYKQKKYEKALFLFKKSIENNFNQKKIIDKFFLCLINLKKTTEVIKYGKKFLDKFPKDYFLNKIIGKALLSINKHEEGLTYLKKSTGFIIFGNKTIGIVTE